MRIIFFGMILLMGSFTPANADGDPLSQLLITGVEVDFNANEISITGNHFDHSSMPVVLIDEFELTIIRYDANEIIASLDAVPGILEGEFTVDVRIGEAEEQHDTHCASVDQDQVLSECDDPPGDQWDQKDRLSIRHVPMGPYKSETDDTVVFTWKDGPTIINAGSNPWGDPKWFQLAEDYTIDLRFILDDYPKELDRCDDNEGWGAQREKRRRVLDEVSCAEWKEDAESAVCSENDQDEGYFLLQGGILTVRRGYRWDGASMVVGDDNRVYPKTAALMRSTMVHDTFYDMLRMHIPDDLCTSGWNCRYQFQKTADCLLFMLSRQDGYKKSKARTNFTIVREWGWLKADKDMPSWKYHALADAGPDQTLVCGQSDGIEVTLDSSGTKFASPGRTWKEGAYEIPGTTDLANPTVLFPPGRYRVTLDVEYHRDQSDWKLADRDEVIINVLEDVEAPVFSPVANIENIENDPGSCGAEVHFNVNANDNCGPPVVECNHASGSWFPVGTTLVSCTATDQSGRSASVAFNVTVQDKESPVINGISNPLNAAPPNHKYQSFGLSDFIESVSDNCTSLSLDDAKFSGAASSELDNANGVGDGSTSNDIVVTSNGSTIQLRRERQGKGQGRTYSITAEAVDQYGNIATKTFQVDISKGNN